jgi:predicted AAA+ superfamily ATPase
MDSFFARDIMNLFPVRSPEKFNALLEYLLRQSGGLMETTKTASFLGISRPTVERHLRALEAAQAIVLVRPFHGGGQKEIVKMPKVYAFDTGFVTFARGWDPLRPEDYGLLWEHLVLDFMRAHLPDQNIRYWRDAAGREVDFILSRKRDEIDAVECKWNPSHFETTALKTFRMYYPRGRNFLVCPMIKEGYVKEKSGLLIEAVGPSGLLDVERAASSRG